MLRVNWGYIKLFLLLVIVVLLYVFSAKRNSMRKMAVTDISFLGEENLFVTQETVSKLLIQNYGDVKNVFKEVIDLNALELALNSNPMIKSAQVYMSVNGILNVDVEQKKPIARVKTNASYYVDDEGNYMPLSLNHTARVPLVTGYVEKNNLKQVFEVAKKVQNDTFLTHHVVEINQSVKGTLSLKLRQCKFVVNLGSLKFLDKKINNLKAFYSKSLKEKTLDKYDVVNLQFDNQVVCTKI